MFKLSNMWKFLIFVLHVCNFFLFLSPLRTRTTQTLFSEKLPASNKCQTCMQRCGERGRGEKYMKRREKISVCSGSWERRRIWKGKDFLMFLSEKLMQSGSGSARNYSRFITWRRNQNKTHTTKEFQLQYSEASSKRSGIEMFRVQAN